MSSPTTEAGKALVEIFKTARDVAGIPISAVGVVRTAAVAIEGEAVTAYTALLAEKVRALVNPFDEGSEYPIEAMQAIGFEKGRYAVLALLGDQERP